MRLKIALSVVQFLPWDHRPHRSEFLSFSGVLRKASEFRAGAVYTGMIPRLIHQTWINKAIPGPLAAYVETWRHLHPDWQYRLWTDADLAELVERQFPEYSDLYRSYPLPIMRADFGRYLILKALGGVYADLDAEALAPFDALLRSSVSTARIVCACFRRGTRIAHAARVRAAARLQPARVECRHCVAARSSFLGSFIGHSAPLPHGNESARRNGTVRPHGCD
jgi:mannosyltransferase OCH1-like enzyme